MKPHRLLTALCAGLLSTLALLPDARAEESCASILARAEYPRGRVVEFPFPSSSVSASGAGDKKALMSQGYEVGDLMRLPADAPGPVALVARLERDLPRDGYLFKTDIPGLAMGARFNTDFIDEPVLFTLQPGQSLADAGSYSSAWVDFFYEASSDGALAEGILDIGMTPGIKFECALGGGEPALVLRPRGLLTVERPTCKVVTEEQVVDLGEHPESALKHEGSATPWVSFDVSFSGCSGIAGLLQQNWDSAGKLVSSYSDPYRPRVEPQGNFVNRWYYGYVLGVEGDSRYPEYQTLAINFRGIDNWIDAGPSAFSLRMSARYLRQNVFEIEPGPKNASLVLMIRYE